MTSIRILALFAALPVLPLAAQSERATRGCFHPHPAERCAWFPVIEAGAAWRFTDVFPGDERLLISWKLGFMKNAGPRSALGGVLFAAGEGELRAGAAVRYRRWLTPSSSLDLQAGVHLVGDASSGQVVAGSPSLEARISSGDWIAGTARFDLLRIQNACRDNSCLTMENVTSPRLYLGAETGSWGGVIGYAATGVLIVVAIISIGNNWAY